MKQIKAIETIYNGYKFRSRLEARWAVFFDKVGVEYEYEMEGFSLPNGKNYLPDFYIPSMDLYVEVKPKLELLTDNELIKIDGFALDGEKNLLLIIGVPGSQEMYIINRCTMCPLSEIQIHATENNISICEEYILQLTHADAEVEFSTCPFSNKWTLGFVGLRPAWKDCKYIMALKDARQSRFEFQNH